MFDLMSACLVFALLCGSSLTGRKLLRVLPGHHRSRETMDFVRIVSSLLVTFTALVLSLLITAVNTDFRKADADLHTYASMIILLDAELESIGPEAQTTRSILRQYTASAIASTWPDEPPPAASYLKPEEQGSDIDASVLGDMLRRVETDIRRITPHDRESEMAQAASLRRISGLLDERWTLIGEAHSSVRPPFFVMMMFWLVVVFISFGLTAPQDPVAATFIFLVGLSLAGAIFIILELDGPLDGLIKVGSEPMRHALLRIGSPLADASGSGAMPTVK